MNLLLLTRPAADETDTSFFLFTTSTSSFSLSSFLSLLLSLSVLLSLLFLFVVSFDASNDFLREFAAKFFCDLRQRSDHLVLGLLDTAEADRLASNRCPDGQALPNSWLNRHGTVTEGQKFRTRRSRERVISRQATTTLESNGRGLAAREVFLTRMSRVSGGQKFGDPESARTAVSSGPTKSSGSGFAWRSNSSVTKTVKLFLPSA